MIKSKQLARALFELSEEKTHDLEAKFFDFIEKKNLKAQLPQVLYHLEKILELDREKKGIQIETAHEISKTTIENIKKYLGAENLSEVLKIKKNLLGGFRAKWNGKVYDSSIMTGLKKLEKVIIK